MHNVTRDLNLWRAQLSHGPESIILKSSSVPDTTFRVAVNVYSDDPVNNAQCTPESLGSCRFLSGEKVCCGLRSSRQVNICQREGMHDFGTKASFS